MNNPNILTLNYSMARNSSIQDHNVMLYLVDSASTIDLATHTKELDELKEKHSQELDSLMDLHQNDMQQMQKKFKKKMDELQDQPVSVRLIPLFHNGSDDHLKWRASVSGSYPYWQAKRSSRTLINGHP